LPREIGFPAGVDHVLLTTKALNRNQDFLKMGRPMQGVSAATCCLLDTLALSGRMRTALSTPLGAGDIVLVGERWF
jgi:hypothetical protein